MKRFRIAFSFAGEKRDFVAEVAAILAKKFGEDEILYDKYHEAEFARARLGRYLPKLYHEDSDLVVVVICRDYAQKEWPGLEWDAVFDLLKKRREDDVMLAQFDGATVEGLFSDAGFIELDHKTPEQAATRILERLALNEGYPKDHFSKIATSGQPVLKTSTPNNLPRLQPFFGREKELAAICEALDPAARTWGTLIDGDGGMGKTSLAVRAAYDASPEHFDRIIFVSVKQQEQDDHKVRKLDGFALSSWLEMINEIAHELELPQIMKAAESDRARLLRTALKGRRALLVLDNLETLNPAEQDQLFTFLQYLPGDCKALLTSRIFAGNRVLAMKLHELDQTSALRMLEEIAKHNPRLAKSNEVDFISLYEEAGGRPLLLRWVAGQVGSGHCTSIGDALAHLRSCPPGNDALSFIFDDLLTRFTAEEISILATLTFPAQPIPVEAIAEISGVPLDQSCVILKSLANRSLVVPYQEETASALVPMVGDFLRRKRPEVVAENGNRLEQRAYALIVENGYQQHDRFPVLDDNWPTVAPALALFVAGPNPRLQTVCDALRFFVEFTGRWGEWLSLERQAEARAVAGGDHANAGWRAYQSGWVHSLRGQAHAVLACADRAQAHWQTAKASARERSLAIRLRGLGHRMKKDYAAAIADFRVSGLLTPSSFPG